MTTTTYTLRPFSLSSLTLPWRSDMSTQYIVTCPELHPLPHDFIAAEGKVRITTPHAFMDVAIQLHDRSRGLRLHVLGSGFRFNTHPDLLAEMERVVLDRYKQSLSPLAKETQR